MCDPEDLKSTELAGLDEDVLVPSGRKNLNFGSQRSQNLSSFPVSKNQRQYNKNHAAVLEKFSKLSAQLKDDEVFQNQSQYNLEYEAILEKLNQLSAQMKDDGVLQNQSQYNKNHAAVLEKLNQLSAQLKDDGDLKAKERFEASQVIKQLNKTLSTLCHPCPCNWKFYKDSCYYFSLSRKPWEAAREDCEADDSKLVIISSSEEQNYLKQKANSNQRWWVGLSDKKKEGTWHWVDGTTLKQAFWNAGEPNNAGDEDCCEVTSQGWNDAPCSKENYWVCEKEASCTNL
ncbi:CD209 antigen isoform X2 [Petaurus breviceps papuanus]|uniref:CD209 antigen isoform X2 n=1 Tax=Petaurus breviceps papuanus TaxID=3040969 RepID=UPI0036DD3D11